MAETENASGPRDGGRLEEQYRHELCGLRARAPSAGFEGVVSRVYSAAGGLTAVIDDGSGEREHPAADCKPVNDKPSKAVARLKKAFPQARWTQAPDAEGNASVGLIVNDFYITDPTVSSCGRFAEKPAAYGLSDAAAKALKRENARLSRALETSPTL